MEKKTLAIDEISTSIDMIDERELSPVAYKKTKKKYKK